jgi:hypothetical protein
VIKKKDGQTKELLNKRQIVEAITQENERKFHQTEGCGQLQSTQITRDIGLLATGHKSDSLFSGTYRIPRFLNAETTSFIRKMAHQSEMEATKVEPVSFDEFINGWRRVKEKTSSTGPHIGTLQDWNTTSKNSKITLSTISNSDAHRIFTG